jgi:hypothetical protein
MDLIYLYEIEQRNLLQLLEVQRGGVGGRNDWKNYKKSKKKL